MAHFAQVTDGIVQQVIVVSNDVAPDEAAGQAFISDTLKLGGVWKQTSYNTYIDDAGVSQHSGGGTPFRGTYAGIGFTYDANADVFVAPPTESDTNETDL